MAAHVGSTQRGTVRPSEGVGVGERLTGVARAGSFSRGAATIQPSERPAQVMAGRSPIPPTSRE